MSNLTIIDNKYSKAMSGKVKETKKPDKFSLSHAAKISKKSKTAFSIPAGPKFSCPGATKACEGCYAMKGRHIFPNVQSAFARNWSLVESLRKKVDTKVAVKLLLDAIPKNIKVFRIHESGDFHDQWYVDMWAKVISKRRDIMFWTYTRSFYLNFSKIVRQPNFTLWASTDDYNKKAAIKFCKRYKNSGVKHAYGPWNHKQEIPKNSFVCPVTNKKMALEGACEKCKLCVVKNRTHKHVVFMAH